MYFAFTQRNWGKALYKRDFSSIDRKPFHSEDNQ